MKTYTVYALLKNGSPIYVGSTCNIKRRLSEHKKPSQFKRKYNDVFDSFNIIDMCSDKETAIKIEVKYHEFYVSTGFNIVGKDAGNKRGSETREKISLSNKGQVIHENTKRTAREWRKNNKVSDETKAKISIASRKAMENMDHRNRIVKLTEPYLVEANNKRKIKIADQYGTIYESLHDCERKTGCRRPSISNVLKGKLESYKGFVFRRYNE